MRSLDTAISCCLDGVTSSVFYRGKQIGETRRYNDGLLIAALRYAAPNALKPVTPNGVSRQTT